MAKGQVITGLNAQAPARAGMTAAFTVRIEELWGWEVYISDPANVRELHDMRIAAKRLRYLFEFFASCFGAGYDVELAKFKQLQDYLGDIHDCDVWVEYLQRQLRQALREIDRGRKALSKIEGAQAALKTNAIELAADLSAGPAHGLLLFISEVADRRTELYSEFTGYWAELGRDGFRERLDALVADAVTGQVDNPEDLNG